MWTKAETHKLVLISIPYSYLIFTPVSPFTIVTTISIAIAIAIAVATVSSIEILC